MLTAVPPGDYSGNFNQDTEFLDTNAVYQITSDGVIAPGVKVYVGPGVTVNLANNVNWLVRGDLQFDDAQQVGFFDNNSSNSIANTSIEVQSGGALDADSTPFVLLSTGNDNSFIEVEQGGNFTADDSDFLIKNVVWRGAAVLGPEDVTNNVFGAVVGAPAEYLPRLANNDSFAQVEISGESVVSDVTLTQMGTVTTTNLKYRFTSDIEIDPGAQLKFDPGTHVELANSVNISVEGKLWFDNVSDVGFFDDNSYNSVSTTSIEVQSGGILEADSTPFTLATIGNDQSLIEINAGGLLLAVDSEFSIKNVIWRGASLLNVGDVQNNVFGAIVGVPVEHVPRLENNDSFNRVDLSGESVVSSVTLKQMGTVTTTNLIYRFTSDIEIDPGAQLKFDPGTRVEVANSVNISVEGKLWFDDVSDVGFFDNNTYNSVSSTSIEVQSGGILEADSTPFTLATTGNDQSLIEINAGGQFLAEDSDFLIKNVIWRGASLLNVGDVQNNVFGAIVGAPVEYVPRLENNDSFNRIDLSGDPVNSDTTLTQMGTVTTTNLKYRFTNDIEIDPGALLKFDPGTRIELANSVNVSVEGKLWFDDVSDVGFFDNNTYNSVSTTSIEVQSGGILEADSTPFTLATTGNDQSFVEINAGGQFLAEDSDFLIKNVIWRGASLLNIGDVQNNVFGAIVGAPVEYVPRLENNDSFNRIDLSGDPVNSDTTLTQMGTVTTTNLKYRFTNDILIAPGSMLKFGPGTTVELANAVNISIEGKLWFCDASEVGFYESNFSNSVTTTSIDILSGGELESDSTQFVVLTTGGNDQSVLSVQPNGIFRSSGGSEYELGLVSLDRVTLASIENSIFSNALNLTVNAETTISAKHNNFGSASLSATGLASETIDLADNWWGTTNPTAIENKILHQVDDASRPLVLFTPFLSQPPRLAEYVPTHLSIDESILVAGQTLTVIYAIDNVSPIGNGEKQSAAFFYLNTNNDQDGSVPLIVVPVESLPASSSTGLRSVQLTLPDESHSLWSNGLPGDYSLSMLVDATNVIPEFDEKNNRLSTGVHVIPPLLTVAETEGGTIVSEDGTTDSLALMLHQVPSSDVVVTATPDEQLDLGNGPGQAVSITITPAEALTPRSISVIASDDTIIEASHLGNITYAVASSDFNFDSIAVAATNVTVIDNDSVRVSEVVINDGSSQRSSIENIKITFNAEVTTSRESFRLRHLDTGELTAPQSTSSIVANGRTTVTLVFDRESVVDGRYELIVQAQNVTAMGHQLDGNADAISGDDFVYRADDFFRFYGDTNGDGFVDAIDLFNGFLPAFGSNEGNLNYRSDLDSNQDGFVDAVDLFDHFLPNFGTSLST
ncbi:hypothetical protein U8335_28210 [Roseiconus lacunae]|uniref:hypothetical protein n=1 Tax=Roseiconus lacunae TaxID=2605694 RepID=UPI00308F2371|nr:hypothetical protein U8335_28210 [Stieleria sp. HD01]